MLRRIKIISPTCYSPFAIFFVFAFCFSRISTAQIFNGAVSASNDDGYETSGGTTSTGVTASGLRVGYDGYYVGLRFQNVTIPQGSTINSASFSAYYYLSQAGITVNIYGDDVDNASVFTTTSYNISGRTATTANVNWTFSIASTTWNTSPDIATIIQEIVNRPGWASGNALCLITLETGTTTTGSWEAWDAPGTNPATITINYTPPTTRDYSGIVYSDEGVTPIVDGTTMRIRVNGINYTNTTTISSGNYSFTGVTVAPGNVVQVYIDGVASTFGCVATVVDGATNLTNLNLFQNYIIVRNDNGGATTNANLSVYDGDDDADIQYTSNAGTLTVTTGHTLYTVNNFTPGGTVNADNLIVKNGIFLVNDGYNLNNTKTGIAAGTGDYVIDVRSGGTLKLDNSTSQITRTDVDADLLIRSGGTLNITAGTLTGFDYHQIEGALNISGGNLTTHNASGLGRIRLTGTSSGSQTGGTITFNTLLWVLVGTTWNATAGLLQTTGNGISNEASIYINEGNFYINNLAIDGEFAIQNSVTAADLDIRGNLVISPTCTFNSNGKPITIAGNWTNSGTYTSGINTVTFNGTSAINTGGIVNHNFYNVILSGTSATLSNHINIDNDFTISNGTWSVYSGGSFYDMYVAGEWINNATFNCTGDILSVFDDFSDGNYTTNPTWAVQNGSFDASLFYLKGVDGVNNERISVLNPGTYGAWEFRYSFEVATTNAYVRFFIIMTSDDADPAGATADGYYIWVDGGGTTNDFEFRRLDNGVPTTLLTYDWIPGTAWHTVKVTRSMDNTFEVFYDGSSIGTVVDATYNDGAYMGIWTTGNIANDDHKIDDIRTLGLGGTVIFDGNATQYVQGTSITTFNNLTVNNSTVTVDDGVILQQSFDVFNTLLMSNGAMDMGNYNISLMASGTLSGETNDTRIFTSGTQTGEISAARILNAPSGVNVAGLGAVITDAANLGTTLIERGHKAQTGGINSSINRYYDIFTETPASATFRFHFFDRELNGQTAGTNMKLWKSTDAGASWTNEGGTWTNAVDDYLEKTGITDFSRWTISDEVNFPLPVELLYFNAFPENNIVKTEWSTASETNNDYFVVERVAGADENSLPLGGKGWAQIGTVQGAGNSRIILNYVFYDEEPCSGLSYYRLRQVDYDGRFSYSEIRGTLPQKMFITLSPMKKKLL
ncbi:MAG: hypothetical protein HYY40_07865 [Bacteroidetes bacterium]|nr:hypothetical protein [Bacteroidota bacterium]